MYVEIAMVVLYVFMDEEKQLAGNVAAVLYVNMTENAQNVKNVEADLDANMGD
jgi:hypothetical protein